MRLLSVTLVFLACGRVEPAGVLTDTPSGSSSAQLNPGWHHLPPEPAGPATRVSAIAMSVDGDRILVSPSLPGAPARVRYRVNGVPVGDGFWQLSLSTWGPFRRGENQVELEVESLPAWKATVVLPTTALEPSLAGPLRVGAPFTARWRPARWTTHASVVMSPLDLPPARLGTPRWQTTSDSHLTATFDGFRFSDGSLRPATRARVTVTATRITDAEGSPLPANGYELSWLERLDVPISP